MKPAVLLVDDRFENLIALESVLDELDVTCVKASSGQEALALALDHEYALIFLDVQMPEMDGFEVAQLLRGLGRTRSTPIIFVTAISKEDRHIFSGYDSGAVDYMFKPLDPSIVRAKARVFLDLYRQRKTIEEQASVLKAQAEQLQQQNEILDRFARVAAHDLQAPLRSMVMFAQMLTRQLGDDLDAKAQKSVDYIQSAGGRMSTLIDDLLSYARLSHATESPLEEVDLEELVGHVVNDLHAELSESGGDVNVGPMPAVMGRPSQLRQLFQNLILNALKYRTEEPPEVTLTAIEIPGGWQFSVTDNGMGIEPKYQKQIFEPFRRLHSHAKISGTGLGLANVVRIVEAHNGRVWVESDGEGTGATFSFTLITA